MAQGKRVDVNADAGPIESAVLARDYAAARMAMAGKLAKMLDATDSARDVKALSLSLGPLLDRCETEESIMSDSDTPLADIMREVEEAFADVG